MADWSDWRINEKYRKPRKAKGTPFYVQRNYYALGVLALAGISWYLYELWPAAKKLKSSQLDGEKFKLPEGLQTKIKHIQLSRTDSSMATLLAKAREKEESKYEKESKPQSCTSKQTESLSKYFTQKKSNIESNCNMLPAQTSESFDSPYKDCLSEIKSIPASDDLSNDFKTTEPMKRKPKVFHKVSTNRSNKSRTKSSKTKKSSKGNYIIKFTEDNFGQTDINPNQLQMALALSKSTYAIENPGHFDDTEDIPSFLSEAKIAKVNTTLERYGFKSSKPKLQLDLKGDRVQAKKSKASKFRFVTPILKIRTEEERRSLISSKISLILQRTKYPQSKAIQIAEYELYSNFLKKFCGKRNVVVHPNRLNQTEIGSFSYYNKNLNITPTKYQCGCLLRDWDEIPGREKSPIKTDSLRPIEKSFKNDDSVSSKCNKFPEYDDVNVNTDHTSPPSNLPKYIKGDSSICHKNPEGECEMSDRNCISPDLFGSDDEIDISPKSPEIKTIIPQPLPPKSRDLLRPVNSESEIYPNTVKDEGLTISNSQIFSSDTGIAHFESYHNNLEELSREVYDLTQSPEDKITEKMPSDLIDNHKLVEYELTQSSKSDVLEHIDYDLKMEKLQLNGKSRANIINVDQNDEFITHIADNRSDDFIDDMHINNLNKIEYEHLDHKDRVNNLRNSIVEEKCVILDLTQDYVHSDDSNSKMENIKLGQDESNNSIEYNTKIYTTIKQTADCKPSERNSTQDLLNFTDNVIENYATIGKIGAVSNMHPSNSQSPLVTTENKEIMEEMYSFSRIPDECQSNSLNVNSENHLCENSSNSFTKEEMSYNSSKLLNVTDYINTMLTNDVSSNQETCDENLSQGTLNETNLSQSTCSQESIIISDEELNYSSIRSKDTEYAILPPSNIYELSDTDGEINEPELKDKQKKHNLRSEGASEDLCQGAFDENRSCHSQDTIEISDEELNYSSLQSKDKENAKHPQSRKGFYELSDTDGDINEVDDQEIDHLHSALKNKYSQQDIPLVHNRITELKDRVSNMRESLARAFLEESFTDLHEDTYKLSVTKRKQNISQNSTLYNKTHGDQCIQNNATENVELTPEKLACAPNDITPENNLIIKRKNITPLVNYDDMDTPNINKELQKFGLKPLKRQRGAKLLSYLYNITHPFVDPDTSDELSSDEDARRIVKKKKKSNKTSKCDELAYNVTSQSNNITLMEDLLEKENLEDLIFERKYSVKIPSCRIPLQIVWHNFVCSNPEIGENILMYEPLQLEVLHSMLKEQSGCKFYVQDLLTFLDKKCITIRTGQDKGGQKPKR